MPAEQGADPLAHCSSLNEQRQQGAAGWVNRKGDHLAGFGLLKVLNRIGEARRGLTRQIG